RGRVAGCRRKWAALRKAARLKCRASGRTGLVERFASKGGAVKQQRAYEHVAVGEAPFYIPAVGSPSRPRRTLKHNETFAVFDSHGDIGSSTGSADGLFSSDTRLLSHLELLIDGARPLLLHSSVHDDNLRYS